MKGNQDLVTAVSGQERQFDVVIVGGCGRAGLPLGLAFARCGLRVAAYDIDSQRVETVAAGVMPFREEGADELLRDVLANGRLSVTTEPKVVSQADAVIIIIGTPIDEFLNPKISELTRCVEDVAPWIRSGSLIVLRSTVYPGSTEWLGRFLADRGLDIDVASCPERITEGVALLELASLPQVVGADTERAAQRAEALFGRLGPKIVHLRPREAELVKLLTNAWRYMKFAVANHFFAIADSAGLDYDRILHAMRYEYPRAADLPGPGFSAGPCLLKDTMQLSAFDQTRLMLGQAAMVVNEGLPAYVVQRIEARSSLRGRVVGILGMAFKKESDDTRESLSYKLRKLLARSGAEVLCTDPYVRSEDIYPLADVMERSDLLIVGAPHDVYRTLDVSGREVVDVWGLFGRIRI